MANKLEGKYNPQEFEEKIYKEWEETGCVKCTPFGTEFTSYNNEKIFDYINEEKECIAC